MEKINLVKQVQSLKAAPVFEPYSKIIVHVSSDTQITVGDDTGRALEYNDPFGTRAQAEAQLSQLRGFQYRPYTAKGALLNPAAEIGDGVTVKSVYGGIYQRLRTFGRLMKADIAAPHDEEVDHEYTYKSSAERQYGREFGDIKASLQIQADRISAEVTERLEQNAALSAQLLVQASQISAKVSQTGGNNSSFGWSLLSDKFSLYSGSKEVFKATSNGVVVDGQITARSGYIGDKSSGFTITASALFNGLSKFNGTQARGVYIGTDGIQLGQNFKVDTTGNVSATNMTLSGTLKIGNQYITAEALRSGAQSAYSNGSTWSGAASTVNTNGSYWSGGASGGYSFRNATKENTTSYPDFFSCRDLLCKRNFVLDQPYFYIRGNMVVSLRTADIGSRTITYLGIS